MYVDAKLNEVGTRLKFWCRRHENILKHHDKNVA